MRKKYLKNGVITLLFSGPEFGFTYLEDEKISAKI